MKILIKKTTYFVLSFIIFASTACTDILDLKPLDKISGEALFSDPDGVKLYMADLYYYLPVEDFNYDPIKGFHVTDGIKDKNTQGFVTDSYSLDGAESAWGGTFAESDLLWWDEAYRLNRSVNLLIAEIPNLNVDEAAKKKLVGETSFIRAYLYYGLVKRYGGVPIITDVQEYIPGETDNLKVPRSTEKDTWDFILKECDKAIANLPLDASEWGSSDRRATKWAALALKSRVALHAASIAKYWLQAPLSGTAVDEGLVGIPDSAANRYYLEAIEASDSIMSSGKYSLYKPNPANPTEAAVNYQTLFETPSVAPEEVIFIKGFVRAGNKTSHNYDWWYQPQQTANGRAHPGRMNPTLDLIDMYESYDNPGYSAPVVTTQDGMVGDANGFVAKKKYLHFNSPEEIFKNKDARLFATINYPGAVWKDVKLVIQGGLVKPNGSSIIKTKGSYTHTDGITYYTYGAESQFNYSGFDSYGAGNMTRTGFLLRKFLQEKNDVAAAWNQSTTDYIDMRYAEVLLNYAEAVIESGYNANNAQQKAKNALNSIRFRAGHTVEIPLTIENVLRERRVELAFENRAIWDMMRRRTMHTEFSARRRMGLMPLLDLRGTSPQYIMVRMYFESTITFKEKWYYRAIPGTGANGLTQNPLY